MLLIAALDGAAAEESAPGTAAALEEVTVEKHRQPLAEVPASVSVFSQRELDWRGVENMNQLQFQVPSLVASDALPSFTLRGVGAESVGPASEAGFALYQNGVYASRVALVNSGFHDLERIEILRGPQGVLYGRNSTGGVMNIISRKPTDEFAAEIDSQYSNGDEFRVRGILNVPLLENRAALRIALQHQHERGLYEQRHAAQRSVDSDDTSLRGSLYWRIRSDLRLDFSWQYIREDGDARNRRVRNLPPSSGYERGDLESSPTEVSTNERSFHQELDNHVNFGTLQLTWKAADFTIRSISGYQSNDFSQRFDGALGARSASAFDDLRSWSSELDILFEDGGPFRFLFAANYFDEKNEGSGGDQRRPAAPEMFPVPHPGVTTAGDGPPRPDSGDRLHLFATARNQAVGTFADGSYEMYERLRIRGGMRYSYTHRDFDDRSSGARGDDLSVGLSPVFIPGGTVRHADWGALTWRCGLDFDLSEDNLVYSTVSTGNRPGGFNFLQDGSFAEEEILAVELGSKNTFFDQRLRINLSAFRYDYDDIQVLLFSPESGRDASVNIPSAEIWGVEADWLAEPLNELLFNGSFGWLNARYTSNFAARSEVPCAGGTGISCPAADPRDAPYPLDDAPSVDIKGNELNRSPEISLNLGLQYTYELATFAALPPLLDGALTARFDFTYRASMFFDIFNRDGLRAAPWNSGDFRLIYNRAFDLWGFAVEGFVQNIWDQEYATNIIASGGGRSEVAFFNEARTYGFRLTSRWR